MTEIKKIISRFGGSRKFAELLDRPESTVLNWQSTALPDKASLHETLLRLAREQGVELTPKELLSATKRPPTETRNGP